MRQLIYVLGVALVSCTSPGTPTPVAEPSPPPTQRAAPQARSPEAGSSETPAEAGTAPTTHEHLGRFRVRLVVEPASDLTCFPMLSALYVHGDGTAWIGGGCGVRGHFDPRGSWVDLSIPWKLGSAELVPGRLLTCPATVTTWSLWGRSKSEVYMLSDKRCGMDPNTIWSEPLRRYDGKRFRALPSRFPGGADVHHSRPDKLAGTPRALYALARGDDWHGPPHCGVFAYGTGGWGKGEKLCSASSKPDDVFDVFADFDIGPDGSIWVAGHKRRGDKVESSHVWWKSSKGWLEMEVDDPRLQAASVAPDGSVWVAGRHVWRRGDQGFERVSTGKLEVQSLWARSSSEAWVVRGSVPFLVSEGQELRAAVEADGHENALREIRGAGDHVWAIGGFVAWQLRASPTSAKEPVRIAVTRPTQADYPRKAP